MSRNHAHQPKPTTSPWRNTHYNDLNTLEPQSPSVALSLESECSWSLIDQRGRTATKNRPSQSRPPEDPTRKAHPQVGGSSLCTKQMCSAARSEVARGETPIEGRPAACGSSCQALRTPHKGGRGGDQIGGGTPPWGSDLSRTGRPWQP